MSKLEKRFCLKPHFLIGQFIFIFENHNNLNDAPWAEFDGMLRLRKLPMTRVDSLTFAHFHLGRSWLNQNKNSYQQRFILRCSPSQGTSRHQDDMTSFRLAVTGSGWASHALFAGYPSLKLTARIPKGSRIVFQPSIFRGGLFVSFREANTPC